MASTREGNDELITKLAKSIDARLLWVYVLAVLKDEPTYPYQVRRLVRERFQFNAPTVTLYTVMYRLEKEGLIVRDEKGMYSVTKKGLEALEKAVIEINAIARKVSESVAEASSLRVSDEDLLDEIPLAKRSRGPQ